ncbi:hypothetical protein LZ32DRAFT_655931 [Colletotrichum eremochloae]|nr:hypothetical protein LZ32DRAFT_655931 [Colletotrichum eremochloae]
MVAGRLILGILVGINDYIFNVEWSHDNGIPQKHVDHTLVTLMLGDDKGAGGIEPTIELFDDNGHALGVRRSRDHSEISKNNKLDDHIINIQHDLQPDNRMQTPAYVAL